MLIKEDLEEKNLSFDIISMFFYDALYLILCIPWISITKNKNIMSENYNSLGKVNDLKSCKEEIKRLNCKLNECETKIKLFEKQQ